MANRWEGFSMVLDSLDVSAELPFEITKDYWLRKAEIQEIERIKEELSKYNEALYLYEYEVVRLDEQRIQGNPLLPDKWKYYVISFSGSNEKLRDIEYAANLLKNYISLGFIFFNPNDRLGRGTAYDLAQISTFFVEHHVRLEPSKSITQVDLREITRNYDLINSLNKNLYPNIPKAISDFHQTKIISKRSGLKVLSYFSIIECLVTHNPSPGDRTDSLTRQITAKMSLLNKRFETALQYKTYFPSFSDSNNIWKKLYDYRSRVAHGVETDFVHEYKAFGSSDNILTFLKEAIKQLQLTALKEPELLADLQNC